MIESAKLTRILIVVRSWLCLTMSNLLFVWATSMRSIHFILSNKFPWKCYLLDSDCYFVFEWSTSDLFVKMLNLLFFWVHTVSMRKSHTYYCCSCLNITRNGCVTADQTIKLINSHILSSFHCCFSFFIFVDICKQTRQKWMTKFTESFVAPLTSLKP